MDRFTAMRVFASVVENGGFSAAGKHRVRVRGPLHTHNGSALCKAAEQGLGITLLSTFIAGAQTG